MKLLKSYKNLSLWDSVLSSSSIGISFVFGSLAISVVPTSLMPRRFATYVSEIVLPSYERMDEVYELKVDADD